MTMGPSVEPVKSEKKQIQVQINQHYNLMRKSGGKSDGTLYKAEVLEKRINPNNNREEFYVHYEGLDRRLDEWIPGKFGTEIWKYIFF